MPASPAKSRPARPIQSDTADSQTSLVTADSHAAGDEWADELVDAADYVEEDGTHVVVSVAELEDLLTSAADIKTRANAIVKSGGKVKPATANELAEASAALHRVLREHRKRAQENADAYAQAPRPEIPQLRAGGAA